jgi:hypothetical protein
LAANSILAARPIDSLGRLAAVACVGTVALADGQLESLLDVAAEWCAAGGR